MPIPVEKINKFLLILTVLFGVLSVATLFSLPAAIISLNKYSSSEDWMPVRADVVLWKKSKASSASAPARVDFQFKYKYKINDTIYTSSKVSAYSFPFTTSLPPRSKRITVYVNPDDHSQAIAVPGVMLTWLGIFFSPILFIIFLYLCRLSVKRRS